MSLNLSVLLLDIDRFRAVQGNRDRALLERVLSDHGDTIAEHDLFYRPRFPRYLSLAEAVERIIIGQVAEAEPLFQYEHAAALIADTMGQPLDPGLLSGSHPDLWEEADLVLRERALQAGLSVSTVPSIDHLLDRGPALAIPLDPVNPLGTGYLEGAEVRQLHKQLARINLQDESSTEDPPFGEDALDVARSFFDWISVAASSGRGLFFHA